MTNKKGKARRPITTKPTAAKISSIPKNTESTTSTATLNSSAVSDESSKLVANPVKKSPALVNEKVKAFRLAARRKQQRKRRLTIGGSALLLLILVAIIGVAVQNSRSKNSTAGALVPKNAVASGAIKIGSGSKVLDIYEDFQCPNCGNLEKISGTTIQSLISANLITANYHLMDFLGPESIRAANAAACASDEGKFIEFHGKLFDNQPKEHTGGFTKAELLTYGKELQLSSAYNTCLQNNTYDKWLKQVQDKSSQQGVVGTPTLIYNKKALTSDQLSPAGLLQVLGIDEKSLKAANSAAPSTTSSIGVTKK